MLTAKLSASLLIGIASSRVADAAPVTMKGWLYDNLCINNCKSTTGATTCTPDGSNAFYTPSMHTGDCLLLPYCIESGHSIMSEDPGEDGRHSVILKLIDDANHTAYEVVKDDGTLTVFPMVEVTFDDAQVVSTDEDGVPSVASVTSMTTVAPKVDPWAAEPEKYYSGAPTTQAVCAKPSDGSADNNMCFRSDVVISTEEDMLVIESNGCPDHMNMMGGSNGAIVKQEMEFPCDKFEFVPECQEDSKGCCGSKCNACSSCGGSTCDGKCNSCSAGGCSAYSCSATCAGGCSSCSGGSKCDAGGLVTCSARAGDCSSTGCSSNPTCSSGCSSTGCSSNPACSSVCSSTGCSSNPTPSCSGGSCSNMCNAGGCTGAVCSSSPSCSGGDCSNMCDAGGCCSNTCCSSKTCNGCSTCGGNCNSCNVAGKGKYTPFYQHYTFKIPKNTGPPQDRKVLKDDVVGIMLNGVILDSHKQTWSYDMCNGHSDDKHQYHYHIPPICYLESMGVAFADGANWWINDDGDQVRKFSEMAIQFPVTATPSPIVGWALDGYPVYALYDDTGALQRSKAFGGSLDECNGKMDSEGNYGYYLAADPPFAPACLKGSKIGTFDYSTYNKVCPTSGIMNTIQLPATESPIGDTNASIITAPFMLMSMAAAVATVLFF